ncbi:MAG: DNA replication and repair protein RecF [Bacteroidales bacterium]|nr:DNA replication and repair protein RecF [Bacteroidales bacterium]
MYLKRINLTNFKNIPEASIEFSEGLNCINGNNGQGKTNLLDAIYYLSMTKSYFDAADRFTFRHGEQTASVQGTYVSADDTEETITVLLDKQAPKQVRRGKKAYERFSDHIGLIPIVMSSPTDTALVNDAGSERRRFVNTFLSQTDKAYLRNLQDYNQLLMQRNKLLKQETVPADLLDVFSARLAEYADYIYHKRAELCDRLTPLVARYHAMLSDDAEEVKLQYVSDLHNGSLEDILRKEAERERILKYTTAGVHHDDILLLLDGHPLRKCGSQGQQKSFLIALKLAQFTIMKESYSFPPILLLDDVFDKLDSKRVAQLLAIVAGEDFGQIFITDSNKVRLGQIVAALDAECAMFDVEEGRYTRIEG